MGKEKKQDYVAEKLTYKKEQLNLYLSDYEKLIESKNSWQVSLSVFITLVVAVMSSNAGWLTYKNYAELILVFSLFISAICLIFFSIRALRIDPVKKLKRDLFTRYINQPDVNSLFIIKRKVMNNDQILVYRCKTWGCYFLPYSRIYSNNPESESKENIANTLDLTTDDIEIEMLLQKHEISEKYHPQENVVKEYHSYYFHLYSSNTFTGKDISKLNDFSVGKKDFEWKTLNDIESDKMTQEKNQDILDILRKNKSNFITGVSSFS